MLKFTLLNPAKQEFANRELFNRVNYKFIVLLLFSFFVFLNIMSNFQDDSIFWIEVNKIKPNPYQPRTEFDQNRLNDLAESIKQYGILQPLVVTRLEITRDDGGLMTQYELIAGERRYRAAKIAGLPRVPAIIRSGEEDERMKLEMAIIENLQREDLNPIDRARAFFQLASEFNFKHHEIARKLGKSREYVSNTIRLLSLPDKMQEAIVCGKVSEGHARPMMMLKDRPEEQETLFKEVLYKKITVREAEDIARKIAQDKIRRKEYKYDPEIVEIENKLSQSLGTRVQIERKEVGGKIVIDYFSSNDLRTILDLINSTGTVKGVGDMLDKYISENEGGGILVDSINLKEEMEDVNDDFYFDKNKDDNSENEEEIYSIRNFSI